MQITLHTLTAILVSHFIADFILQWNTMAIKKSINIWWLLTHGVVYGIGLFTCMMIFKSLGVLEEIPSTTVLEWAIFNTYFHLVIDYFTSKLTTKYWSLENKRPFFNIIGLDQLMHNIVLFTTYQIIKV
jgi:hypothetical protein